MEVEICLASSIMMDKLILKRYMELYGLLLDNDDGILMDIVGWWKSLMEFSSKWLVDERR